MGGKTGGEVPLDEPVWRELGREVVHDGRARLARRTVELPDGSFTDYEVDESCPFAAAVLLLDGDRVLLTRQYRHPVGRWIFDLPAGSGKVGELPVEAARRELEEETGLHAEALRPLHTFFLNPARTEWPVHIFISDSGFEATGRIDDSDPAEQVRSVWMPVAALDGLIASGEIVDPTLIVARSMAAARGIMPQLGAL